jgi:glutathione peroxidase
VSTDIRSIALKAMTGETRTLRDFGGRLQLIVNVASKCGLTPQYAGLESLYRRYKDRGLVVLGFPANDFLQQEPGTDAEIATFCRSSYDVSFPVLSKIAVTGDAQHPLYSELVKAQPLSQGDPEEFRKRLKGYGITTNPEPGVLWNFEKFLVAEDGSVRARFAPSVTPEDPILIQAIESGLSKA